MWAQTKRTSKPDSFDAGLSYALRLLSGRFFGEAELGVRLAQKGFESKLVGKIILELKRLDYINDGRFLEDFICRYKDFGTYGRLYIQNKLLQKHFSRIQIETVLERCWNFETERVCARRLLEKTKLPKDLDFKIRQKFIAKLLRYGFSADVALRILQ